MFMMNNMICACVGASYFPISCEGHYNLRLMVSEGTRGKNRNKKAVKVQCTEVGVIYHATLG